MMRLSLILILFLIAAVVFPTTDARLSSVNQQKSKNLNNAGDTGRHLNQQNDQNGYNQYDKWSYGQSSNKYRSNYNQAAAQYAQQQNGYGNDNYQNVQRQHNYDAVINGYYDENGDWVDFDDAEYTPEGRNYPDYETRGNSDSSSGFRIENLQNWVNIHDQIWWYQIALIAAALFFLSMCLYICYLQVQVSQLEYFKKLSLFAASKSTTSSQQGATTIASRSTDDAFQYNLAGHGLFVNTQSRTDSAIA